MVREVWLLKGREDDPWPFMAFASREAASEACERMHGDLGGEEAFMRPVRVFRDFLDAGAVDG